MIKITELGIHPYLPIWNKMKSFTATRTQDTDDELWLLQHPSVYTQGQAGKPEHILNPGKIPIVQSDRGGQITYHGPGQLIAYVLMDLRRRNLGIRRLVSELEQLLITVLETFQVNASTRSGAPGVYVEDKKIASIGLRVKNGCSYHGIALNVAMDLSPFRGINPCGFARLEMTQIRDFVPDVSMKPVQKLLVDNFLSRFEQ